MPATYEADKPETYRDRIDGALTSLLIDLDELSDVSPLTENECRLYMAIERHMCPENEIFRPENLAATEQRYLASRSRIGRKDEPKKVILDALGTLKEAAPGEYPQARKALREALRRCIRDYDKKRRKLVKANRQVTGQRLTDEEADELMAEVYDLA